MCDNVSPDLTICVLLDEGVTGFVSSLTGIDGAGIGVVPFTLRLCPTNIKSLFKLFNVFKTDTVILFALAMCDSVSPDLTV